MNLCSFWYFLIIVQTISAKESKKPQSSNSSHVMGFLMNYGYLPSNQDLHNEMNLISGDQFKKAIQLMQKFSNIPQTGLIDEETLKKMRAPRCALPDVHEKSHHISNFRRSKRFLVYGTKWEKFPITWSLVQPSKKLSSGEARQVFHRAFNVWSQASNKLKFQETMDPKADILIGFYSRDHLSCGSRQAFDGPGIKLAHAFGPQNGDVHFDDDENWADQGKGLNLFWTALHEFGHSLGFGHTADESSIMFPYYREHGENFKLPEVDKSGVRYLYGELDTERTSDKLPFPTDKNLPKVEVTTNKGSDTTTDQPKLEKMACQTNIDAIASIRGDIFVFKNKMFWWVKQDLTLTRKEPILISQYFIGFPSDTNNVDAVYERKSDQMIIFFVGKQYWIFNANQLHEGPKPITDLGLPESIEKIDAVTTWGHNGRTYLFTGPVYWRFDENEKKLELDYPRDMTVWKNIPINLDAAFTWIYDSSTYFFKNEFYWKFDNMRMQADSESPKLIQKFLFRSIDCPTIKPTEIAENYEFKAQVSSSSSISSIFLVKLILIFSLQLL